MKEIKPIIIISRYNEDVNWIKEYTENYIIYNKGEYLNNFNEKIVPNIGGNQRDLFQFVFENYDDLPDYMIFVQGFPFDHCNKEKFNRVMYNNFFTPLESYKDAPRNDWNNLDIEDDYGYMEINNSWYIDANNKTQNLTCRYESFDHFMNSIFKNYQHLDWLRFAPGSQYLITKEQCLKYSKKFWDHLMNELNINKSSEAHIIERAMIYILTKKYEEQDYLK